MIFSCDSFPNLSWLYINLKVNIFQNLTIMSILFLVELKIYIEYFTTIFFIMYKKSQKYQFIKHLALKMFICE